MIILRVFLIVWIYNYLYNRCLSPLTLWVRIPLRQVILETTLCDKICQWLATGWWFSPGTLVSSTNKTDHHDIIEILLKLALSTITLTPFDIVMEFVKHFHQNIIDNVVVIFEKLTIPYTLLVSSFICISYKN